MNLPDASVLGVGLNSANAPTLNGSVMCSPAVTASLTASGGLVTVRLRDAFGIVCAGPRPVWLVLMASGALSSAAGDMTATAGSVRQQGPGLWLGLTDAAGDLVVSWDGAEGQSLMAWLLNGETATVAL